VPAATIPVVTETELPGHVPAASDRLGPPRTEEIERVVRLSIRLAPAMPPGRIQERRAIVTAILACDEDAAREAMARRTASAQREILAALTTSASVTSAAIALPP
jgi:GntR family transcriptional regulator, rspAB operon transcriptional repressor